MLQANDTQENYKANTALHPAQKAVTHLTWFQFCGRGTRRATLKSCW